MSTFQHKSTTWEPPPELQRSTPREVELTCSGKALVIAMIALVLAAVAGSITLATRASADDQRWAAWQAEAVSVQAEVTQLRKRGSGDNTKYYVDYQYRTGKGQYAASGKIKSREWRRLKQGDVLGVSYRRSEPSQSWIEGHEPTGIPSWTPLLLGLALLLPVPYLAYSIRRQRRLLEEGRGARGRVTKTKKLSSDKGSYYQVDYEFATLEGSQRVGRYSANRRPPEIGEPVVVLYHPDEEKWSAKYPLSLVRVRPAN